LDTNGKFEALTVKAAESGTFDTAAFEQELQNYVAEIYDEGVRQQTQNNIRLIEVSVGADMKLISQADQAIKTLPGMLQGLQQGQVSPDDVMQHLVLASESRHFQDAELKTSLHNFAQNQEIWAKMER